MEVKRKRMPSCHFSVWDLLPYDLEQKIRGCVLEIHMTDVRDKYEKLRMTEYVSRFEDVELTTEWHGEVQKLLEMIEDIRRTQQSLQDDINVVCDDMTAMQTCLENGFQDEFDKAFAGIDWGAIEWAEMEEGAIE